MSSPSVPERRMAQVARSVLRKNVRLAKGENITIEGFSHSLDWAVAFAREARHLGAFPMVLHEDEEAYWDAIARHEDDVLGAAPGHEWGALAKTDVYLHMWGYGDKLRLANLPPARQEKLFAFNDRWYAAAAKAHLRGFRLELGRPYPTLARLYGVDEKAWTDQVIAATLTAPAVLSRAAQPIVRALSKGRRLTIVDDRGTDVTLGLRHRPASTALGQLSEKDAAKSPFRRLQNLPGGSVTVALDETVADGTFVANRTSYTDAATMTGGRFEFRNGKLVDHSFKQGGKIFEGGFRAGGRGRDRPGQLRFGLNPGLHNTPQVEDLEQRALTLSVGGNRFVGGKNPSPFFGFVVNAGARVEIDGRPVPGFG